VLLGSPGFQGVKKSVLAEAGKTRSGKAFLALRDAESSREARHGTCWDYGKVSDTESKTTVVDSPPDPAHTISPTLQVWLITIV
jgi:hypothetical protein